MLHNPPAARPLGPDADGQWVRRWTSPDWTQTVDAWVSSRLAERGRRITGEPVTYRARLWSVTRCYPSTGGLVWFKENNPGHRFESRLVAAMAQLAPDDLVVPITVDHERGWLLTDDQGTHLTDAEIADQSTRSIVVCALARLQCALLGNLKVAEHSGLVVLAPNTAGERVSAIAREWTELQPGHPLRLEPDELQRAERAADLLNRRTESISDAVPLDLEPGDVYGANILADRSAGTLRLRFFDFGNAIWGHPFVTLHGFLDSVEEWTGAPLSRTDRDALYDAYLTVWRDHLDADPQQLRDDLAATETLLVVHRLVSWLRLVPHADPIEIRTRGEIPRQYLANIVALAG